MTLKILRLKVPRKFLEKIELLKMLDDIDWLEVLNAYQYDQTNFFSLQRIRFKPNRSALIDKIFKEKMKAQYYEVLNQQGDEVLCILKQTQDTGFFPMFGRGPWAIIFPISVGEIEIHLNLLAEEQELSRLTAQMTRITDSYDIISISNVHNVQELDQTGLLHMPLPNFTAKQRDVAMYAAQKGYFESPKKITAKALAEHFDITESAVNMHLKNAENLAMKFFFGGA